CMQALQPPYSF
nr:immunoglobulin light chain junction region [Macaca mulatta]